MPRFGLFAAILLMLAGCEPRQDIREFGLREVVMPNGKAIKAEPLRDPIDMARGAMFRTSIPDDRGFLYEYAQAGKYGFWMYQTPTPLDTIWLDKNRQVIDLETNMKPCPSKSARECPLYGGRVVAVAVLQLRGGMAEKYGVRIGSVLTY